MGFRGITLKYYGEKKMTERSIVQDFKCKKCKHKTSARIDSTRFTNQVCNDCDDIDNRIYPKGKWTPTI